MNGISKSITRNLANKTNEKEAAKAFSKQARIFDDYDAGNTIIQ